MGVALSQAQSWLAERAEDLPEVDREFIALSVQRHVAERMQREQMHRRTRQLAALVGVLMLGIGTGLAWNNRAYLKARAITLAEAIWPQALTVEAERALKPAFPSRSARTARS